MELYNKLCRQEKETSVALGCFDGIHLGHAGVLRCALQGKEKGLLPAVFTFTMGAGAKASVKNAPEIMTMEQKSHQLEKMGFGAFYSIDFASVRSMEPEQFVSEVLKKQLRAKRVCCGFNYRFGKHGRGDTAMLSALCAKLGIETCVIPAILDAGAPVSSTRIRRAIAQGDMPTASRLLGRPFLIDFPVVRGNQIGRVLGTPTINQPFPPNFILPRFGVYASAIVLNKKEYHGVTNVGVKPTVGSAVPLAETWISAYEGDLYDKQVPVYLLEFLRDEKKFASLEQLKQQILQDGKNAEAILRNFMLDNENTLTTMSLL